MKELTQKWARTLDDMESAAERIARNQAAHRHADDVLTARVGARQRTGQPSDPVRVRQTLAVRSS